MKNKEKYADEIIEAFGKDTCIYRKKVILKIESCCGFGCEACNILTKEWLEAEYVEPIKLSKRERAFLEYAQTGWIARDGSEALFLYDVMPTKKDGFWKSNNIANDIISDLFTFIKWEDEEAWSVEELLKLEVKE